MVAMVDVLGVGSKTLAESRDFLQRFTKFEVLLRDYTTRFFKDHAPPKIKKLYEMRGLDIVILGDTIVILWELKPGKIQLDLFYAFQVILAYIVISGLQLGLAFRGAFSVGKFMQNDGGRTVVGPAVHTVCEIVRQQAIAIGKLRKTTQRRRKHPKRI